MTEALFIIVDQDFRTPAFAEPELDEVDADIVTTITELVDGALDADGPTEGTVHRGERLFGWLTSLKTGVTIAVVVTDDVEPAELKAYIRNLQKHYFDEVDDVRRPERDGVADVVVDVIPPWEE